MLRATFKSLLSRKLRLILSGMAVVLGVMAVSGAFILSNTLTVGFDALFKTVTKDLDVQVTGKTNVELSADAGQGLPNPVPGELVDELESKLTHAKKIERVVAVDGARVVSKKNGKVIPTQGAPRLGLNWLGESDLITLSKGSGPKEAKEVAISQWLADKGDYKVGDTIEVLTLEPKQPFVVSGIFQLSGGRSTLGGETYVSFTTPVAQKLMLGKPGHFSSIDIEAKDGVSQKQLKDEVAKIVGGDYVVNTGQEVADEQAQDLNGFIKIFRNFLLGFAAVALFVGIFLILNTFSIIVAQRTKELALFRAMGASRKQVIGSVLIEALIIGIIASTIGFVAGIGIAAGLKALMEAQSGSSWPGEGLSIPSIAVIASYVVGIIVTIIAAVLPALRASRIAPVAAMRDSEDKPKPLYRLTIAGTIVTLTGVALIGWNLFGDASVWMLAFGALLSFVGVAMITPVIARPVVDVVGRLFSWSLPGKLGRRNSARNPRRTAITAAALMVGIALVTGVTVLASSLKSSLEQLIKTDVAAELIIGADSGDTLGFYDATVIDEVKQLPDVRQAGAMWLDSVGYDGSTEPVQAARWGDMADMFDFRTTSGEFRTLSAGEVMVDDKFATRFDLSVGSVMPITFQRGGDTTLKVIGIYKQTSLWSGPLVGTEETAGFRNPSPSMGFVKVKNGASVNATQDKIDALLADNPEVTVQNQNELLNQNAKQIDQFLMMLYMLLGLAVVIAILGIVNTLALSILERTRELGLLRAVGLTRAQTMRMVTVESIVISLFGALLGLAVGSALGTAIVKALEDEGINKLDFPLTRMLEFLLIAIVVGLFAAILPAIRAARTNVLKAISYE